MFVYLCKRHDLPATETELERLAFFVVQRRAGGAPRRNVTITPRSDLLEFIRADTAPAVPEPLGKEALAILEEELGDGDYELWVFHYVKGMTYEQIARALEMELRAVKSRMACAIRKVKLIAARSDAPTTIRRGRQRRR